MIINNDTYIMYVYNHFILLFMCMTWNVGLWWQNQQEREMSARAWFHYSETILHFTITNNKQK